MVSLICEMRSRRIYAVIGLGALLQAGCDDYARAQWQGRGLRLKRGEVRVLVVGVQESTGRLKAHDIFYNPLTSLRPQVSCQCPAFVQVHDVGQLKTNIEAPGPFLGFGDGYLEVSGKLVVTVSTNAPVGEHNIDILFSHAVFALAESHKNGLPGAVDLSGLDIVRTPTGPHIVQRAEGGPNLRSRFRVRISEEQQ